jgi:hypothetical protein
MTILSSSDINDLSTAWNLRRDTAFRQRIEDDFVELMLRYVPENLKEKLLWAIHQATNPAELSVSYAAQFDIDHTFTAEGWGDRRCSIKNVVFHSNALARLGEAIGPNIRVVGHVTHTCVYFTIDFWPPRVYPHVIHNPEEEHYDDMPPLEGE